MKRSILSALALTLALPHSVIVAAEPEASMSFQGYSGLINTPTATLFDEGKFYLQYGNQVETRSGYRSGTNYNFGVGVWEYVEVSGRLADYDFRVGNDVTDLSANIKLGIPYIPKDWFSLAVGIQDLGGAANYFDAKYVVASKNIVEELTFSLGIGKSDSNSGRLDGVFAGMEWQPYQWAKLSVEYDAADTQLGLHLSTPSAWFDSGVQLSTDVVISSTNEALSDDVYYGVGLTVPLDFNRVTKTSHSSANNQQLSSDEAHWLSDETAPDMVDRTRLTERLRVQKLLVNEGFEAIKVGEADLQTIYVEVENHIYNRNQIDGLGVLLGLLSKTVHYNYSHFTVVLKEREIPVLIVKGSLAEYDAFLTDNRPLKVAITTDTFATQRQYSTAVRDNSNNFWLKPRFTFWPGIVSRVGTEFGAFDASLALVSHAELPLWHGAAITAVHTTQIAETEDFKDGKYFGDNKQRTGLRGYSFHQTFSLPYSVKNMTSVGRFRDTYDYLSNEVRWQSVDGSHKVSLVTARYDNQEIAEVKPYANCNILLIGCWPAKELEQRDVIIGKYRYYNAELNTSAELKVGQYWQQDKGAVVKVERMFGDVSLNLTYKNTKVDNEEANQFIGIGFSIPLTPRKDFNNKYFQVRGKTKWAYSVSTLVGKSHNNLTPGSGDSAELSYNLDSAFYNNDRLSFEYIYANANRLKQAYYQAR
ncbi:YjbH domain-containing protein [Colwellia sp. C1TZA3]|uniref:YjbH domain-containing protein n=1 Tax=Colwellia sp. C1TZA3 TaxID=2508879 RepID=UPI0011B9C5E3|nr:YjbH domain-containing protein [Colwellia sp. C1TZA3]TWX72966.1 YjbH domain-containing protein [Colwellia sp. C1TZA3]